MPQKCKLYAGTGKARVGYWDKFARNVERTDTRGDFNARVGLGKVGRCFYHNNLLTWTFPTLHT